MNRQAADSAMTQGAATVFFGAAQIGASKRVVNSGFIGGLLEEKRLICLHQA
jgi:hypothetical protein